MQITREADYSVRCVMHLSLNQGRPIAVGEIVEAQGVPKSFAAKILQKLVKAGIVKSLKGARGGFLLAREPEEISLLDVYEAASGPLSLNVCVNNPKSCERSGKCQIHPVWIELSEEVKKKLSTWNFKKLSQRQKKYERRKEMKS